jgi:hypothetical protein
MVLLVASEVFGKLVDPSGQQSHLNLRRAGVGRIATVLRDDFGFLCRFESHFNNPLEPPYSAANQFYLLVEAAHHTQIFGAAPSS